MEGPKGEVSRKLRVYNKQERQEIDSELTTRTMDNGPEDVMPWRGWAGPDGIQ